MTAYEIISYIITAVSGAGGGAILGKYLIPKEKQKEFEAQLRDDLWDRIKHLEGRLDEQNKMLIAVLSENAILKSKIPA